jgi:membrane protease subunit HflK
VASEEEEGVTTEQKIERSVVRTIFNWLVVLAALAVIVSWFALKGWIRLEPGMSAVVLRLGEMHRTITEPGIHLVLPVPLEHATVVSVAEIRHLDFGVTPATDGHGDPAVTGGVAMQTADSNIVMLSYELQYRVDDAYAFLFGMAEPNTTLFDATQSAVREVVGRKTIDEVLSTDRSGVEREARTILQATLDSYFEDRGTGSAFEIRAIELQNVQPPQQVAQAFADVVSAQQDEVRAVSVARGDAREIEEGAAAKVREHEERSQAYKEAKVLEARGEATRFLALLEEYRRAPEVTRSRLYLETMESVLPGVEKMVVVPFLPMQAGRSRASAPPVRADSVQPNSPEAEASSEQAEEGR